MDEFAVDFGAMGSDCEVRACASDGATLRLALQAAIDEVQRIERKYSRYRPDSVVSLINQRAGTGVATEVDDETDALLEFAGRLHEASAGQFDITSGVLRRAWDFRQPRLPQADELQRLVGLVGWHKVVRDGSRIQLSLPEMELDFGGFGKEYAADRAAGVLIAAGVRHGYINLGGDLRVVGPRGDDTAWVFGIQHPRRADGLLGHVELAGGALATSGDYERYIEVDGRRYCHVLDARTGWPVKHWQSISVVAPTCAAAGALCTLALLTGAQALDFLAQQRADFLAMDSEGIEHRGGAWTDTAAS